MGIKSVREISFFQNLRDKDISLCFCNFVPTKNSDEIVHLMHYLVSITNNDLAEKSNLQLEQLDKDCLTSLSVKLEKHILDMKNNFTHVKGTVEAFKNQGCCMHALQISGKITLSFIELINLYHVFEHFETNYEDFKSHTKDTSIPHQILSFTLSPSSYYTSIHSVKSSLQNKLGELVVNSYKLKNK